MSTEPFTLRWGIMATGWIASVFAEDLMCDPAERGTTDVKHTITAVGSSTSVETAKKFIEKYKLPSTTIPYGTYEELVANPDVDAVYIATPHSHHFQNAVLALRAGKHVLCEKAFTVNAEQTKILIDLAREKKLFLMEAVWTRFFPLSKEVRRLVQSGEIGEVKKVFSWLDLAQDPERLYADGKHRMVNPELAGGAMLDLGIYPLTWVYQILYHDIPADQKAASHPKISGAVSKYHNGVDIENVIMAQFPNSIGVASSGMRVDTDPDDSGRPCARIMGTKGEIQIAHPPYRPTKFTILKRGEKPVEREFPIPGDGKFYEADETARCIRDGKLESETFPLEESLLIMKDMDRVRELADFQYPEWMESTKH